MTPIRFRQAYLCVKAYGYQHKLTAVKYLAVGLAGLCIQLFLQHIEKQHGYNILWWSLFQGSILANIGMAVNKKWTFRERDLPWMWAILTWNVQKVPHSAVSTLMFAALLQIPLLPYWGATVLTAGSIGIGSFVATEWLVGRKTTYEILVRKLAAVVTAGALIFRRKALLKTEMA